MDEDVIASVLLSMDARAREMQPKTISGCAPPLPRWVGIFLSVGGVDIDWPTGAGRFFDTSVLALSLLLRQSPSTRDELPSDILMHKAHDDGLIVHPSSQP